MQTRPVPLPARIRSPRDRRGLTIVEAAVLVCIVGVVLAVFVPTFLRHVRLSKISEASEQLDRLHVATAAYYAASHATADGRRLRRCLPPEAGPAPDQPSAEPVAVDFSDTEIPGRETWVALSFTPDHPIRYRYSYYVEAPGCDLDATAREELVSFRAEGDLDGDGELSTFERAATTDDGELVPLGILHVVDRVE